jgi:AcrR family transcriptional regulator
LRPTKPRKKPISGRARGHAPAASRAREAPRTSKAETTRDRILEAALYEFAEFGLLGASLRDISGRSQVPLSALHYHFGSKEDLFAAAVEHVFRRLSANRLDLLRELEMSTRTPTLEAVLEAFILPTLKLASDAEGTAYLRLQARMYDAREVVSERLMLIVLEATAPFRRAMAQALPDLPEHHLVRGYRAMVRDVLSTIADPTYELLTGKPSLPLGRGAQELVDMLVRYHAAGLRAMSGSCRKEPA